MKATPITDSSPRITYKISRNDWNNLKGFATFLYDHNVLPNPTVHALSKFASFKFYNEWSEVQANALALKAEREQVTRIAHTTPPPVGAPVKVKPVIPPRPVRQPGETLEQQYNELYSSQLPDEEIEDPLEEFAEEEGFAE